MSHHCLLVRHPRGTRVPQYRTWRSSHGCSSGAAGRCRSRCRRVHGFVHLTRAPRSGESTRHEVFLCAVCIGHEESRSLRATAALTGRADLLPSFLAFVLLPFSHTTPRQEGSQDSCAAQLGMQLGPLARLDTCLRQVYAVLVSVVGSKAFRVEDRAGGSYEVRY